MILIAAVTSANSKNVGINCPDLNIDSSLSDINNQPGLLSEYAPGNSIIICKEDNNTNSLAIVGKVYTHSSGNDLSIIESATLNIDNSFSSESYPQIGIVSKEEFACLKDLNTNFQQFYDDCVIDNTKKNSTLTTLNKNIGKQATKIETIELDIKALSTDLKQFEEQLGQISSTLKNTICGQLNNSLVIAANCINKIGDIGGDNLASIIENITNEISSVGISSNSEMSFDTSLGNSMLDRAEKMVNHVWTAKRDFHMWNSSILYKAGKQYKGIPYTLFWGAMYYDKWVPYCNDNKEDTDYVSGYGLRTGPVYGSCCASFVSDILNINPKTASCNTLIDHKNLRKLSGEEAKVKNLRIGDVLIKPDRTHCKWVGPVTDSEITIYEQTNSAVNGIPTGARKYTVSKSSVTNSNGNYKDYNVYRPKDLEESITTNNTKNSTSTGSTVPYTVHGNSDFEKIINYLKDVKFPHNKYWNHMPNVGKKYNNQDGYTNTPCINDKSDHTNFQYGHGYCEEPRDGSKRTCNGYAPNGTEVAWQCMGYACKIGYDLTGYDPRSSDKWTTVYNLNSLKPGDIIRYKNNGHSIFVLTVSGDDITITDCNSDGHCIIKWGTKKKKSEIAKTLTSVITYTGSNYNNSPILKQLNKG